MGEESNGKYLIASGLTAEPIEKSWVAVDIIV
jgi:hypothetical protein